MLGSFGQDRTSRRTTGMALGNNRLATRSVVFRFNTRPRQQREDRDEEKEEDDDDDGGDDDGGDDDGGVTIPHSPYDYKIHLTT
ncbi:hypothetical protein LX32DRAFT_640184 [Colletotrichum zoysiae]|uniref:Uncharacterized protein n=1 Tax=Colletotrichum zoysiae TaxID=1216348 RepID=A0AAD9HFZ0_9PEZI|nr:hypothetical protein LX32DRAFT_640184 [Colletotrichum zoysiae]